MAIKILTDTSSELTEEMIKDYDIEILPLLVYIDEQEYLDTVNIDTKMVAEAMLQDKEVKTAQVPIIEFYNSFMRTDENDTVICVPISSEISGTYYSALQALDMAKEKRQNIDIRVLDVKCVSMGLGLLVLDAAEKIKNGASVEEIEKYFLSEGPYRRHLFTVPNLKWLLKGGRVSKAKAVMGTLLDIKPILHVEEGKLIPFESVRGSKKRIHKLCDYIQASTEDVQGQTVAICHVMNIEDANKLKEFFLNEMKAKEVIIKDLGPVIAAHCGPGLLTMFYRSTKPVEITQKVEEE